jgi:hypothetical protein
VSGAEVSLAESTGGATLDAIGRLEEGACCPSVADSGFSSGSGPVEANCGEEAIRGSHENNGENWPGDEVSEEAGATG